MLKRIGNRYAVVAAVICGAALLILTMRAAALRAEAMGDGTTVGNAVVGQARGLLQATIASTGTLEPRAYFPVVFRDWFQEYTVQEHFDPPVVGWPEGSVRNTITVHQEFNYGPLVDEGDGSTVYQVGIRDNNDHVFLTGPVQTLEDFEYEVWMRRLSDQPDQQYEYGILISPTPIDPAHPSAEGVYSFQIQLGYKGAWWVKKWNVYSLTDHPAETIAHGETPAVTEAYKQWNQFRIRRVDDTLYFDATHGSTPPAPGAWVTLASHTDHSMPDQFYTGFFGAHAGITMWRYYQYDNVYVHAHP